ncbi:MAG: hypothetical protein PVI50_04860, partial [Gammaproteobacteria bacterium]
MRYFPENIGHRLYLGCLVLLLACCDAATTSPPVVATPQAMLQPVAAGWQIEPLLTIGTSIDGYWPPGKPDGLGVFTSADGGAALLVNHELDASAGGEYRLANGTRLRGARITRLELDREAREVLAAGLAYERVYDRTGSPVSRAGQINETGAALDGLSRLCSARAVRAGHYNFENDIFFSGEEVTTGSHPQGGTLWALDVNARTLWPVNAIGRGAWENVTPLEHPAPQRVALLASSDIPGAPLYLYVGIKDAASSPGFLERNGLLDGSLYCWRADDGVTAPRQFHGEGAVRDGHWLALSVRGTAETCSETGACDRQGYLNSNALQQRALEQ